MKEHHYKATTEWTRNEGAGAANSKKYSRNHMITVAGKSGPIEGSSDPAFGGDATRYNPEELLVSSISACHMLWYLRLCSDNGIIVTDYVDQATGTMEETADGSGRFKEVTLHPIVTITDEAGTDKARSLHQEANRMCFIANSCNFPVKHACEIRVG